MPIQIQVPGLGIAEFPDGVTYDQAFAAIKEDAPDFQPSREDAFAAMRQKSDALAGPDKERFLNSDDQFSGVAGKAIEAVLTPFGFGGVGKIVQSDAGASRAAQNFLEQSAGKSLAGAGSMVAAAGRVLDMPLDSHYKAEEKAGRPVNRIEAKFRNPFQEAADQIATHESGGKTSQFLSDTVGGVAPSAVAGLLTGGVGAAGIAGAQQFGDTRKRVLDYYKSLGLPEYEAQSTADQLGALSGAITAAATKYTPQLLGKIPGVGKYLGEQGAEGLAKKLLIDRLKQSSVGEIAKRIVGNAAGEATEEGVNQFLLEVVESKQLEPNLSWTEIAKRTGMAAAQGAVGGAGVSAVGETIRKGMDMVVEAQHKRFVDDAVREHAANQLAQSLGLPPIHEPQKAPFISQREAQSGLYESVQPGGVGIVDRVRQLEKSQRRANVEAGLVGPATYYPSTPITEEQSVSGISEIQMPEGQTPVDAVINEYLKNRSSKAAESGLSEAPPTVDESTTTPFDAAVLQTRPQRTVPPLRPEHEAALRAANFTLDALDSKQPVPAENVSDLAKLAPSLLRVLNARIDKAIEVNATDQELDRVVSERDRLQKFYGQFQPKASLADRLYNKLDEMDKGLNQNVYASITGLEVPVAKLVLKTAKLAIRAGQSVAEAVRSAIAKAKQQFPDAKFDSAAFEKSILADLQPLLSGQEEQSVIAKAAEPFVKANEDAAARIDQVAFTGVQLGKARQDLRDKRDEVVQLALAQGIPVSDIPSESSSKLAEVAASLGGDAAGIQDIQARVNHEERARELHSINKQIDELTGAETRLLKASPGKYADVLSYLAESKSKLAEKAAKNQFDDVRDRASEIALQEAEKISNTAKRDALQNGHVVSAIIGPVEEMRKLLEETPELQGRTAEEMLADPLVSDDTKQLFVIRMSSAFRAFDQSRENLESDLISSEGALNAAIERLQGKLMDARMDKAFADIVISDAGRALKGETGLAGGLNPKWVEWYDNNQSALRSFARSLATATGPNAVTAQKLMDWIRFGVDASAMPDLRNTAAHNWGVGDEVLNEIKTILLESRATRNAVALIYSAGNQKLAAHELRKIATAAAGGDEDLANALFDKLVAKTDSEKAKLTALSRELSSELEKKRLELETLKEAKLLFDRVATSPTFVDGRNAVENAHGSFMQQFLLRKNDQLGFAGFKMPDGSEQPNIEISGGVSGTAGFDRTAGEALIKWNNNAESYVSQYDVAQDDFDSGVGPNPVQLGFDPAVYRGLKYTLNYEMPGILDGTLFNPGENVDYSGMNQLFQSLQWFRQIDATARKVKGVFGNAMRQAITDFRDVNMLVGKVAADPFFNEIPKLLSAAMASHKAVGGESFLNRLGPVGRKLQERFAVNGNLEKYRELVFNPMANIGRGFGTLKVGTVLPTGEVVTQADIDLLKRAQERDRALYKIAGRRGKGQSQGYGGKEFRREAGSVGDLGTPRHINNYGEDFIRSLSIAAKNLGRNTAFTWDQLASGDHPVLKAWRSAAADHFALNAHVHDSAYRTDRDVQVHPFMRQAYRNLAESMEASGWLNKIDSVGELAEHLVQHFPADTGFDPRQFVLDQLNSEFDQYNRNAVDTSEKFASDSGESIETILKNGFGPTRLRSASIIETETSNNEFTKPAAQLKIPSSFYDYSSISPLEMTLSKSRAIGERVVDMKNAMRAAITSLNTTIAKLSTSNDLNAANAIAKELNMSVSEATAYLENVRDNLNGIDAALGRNWAKDNAIVAGAKQGGSLFIGGSLSGFATGAMNVMSSPASAFVFHSMINRGGALALSFNTAKYTAKLSRNVVYGALHAVSESTASTFKAGFDYLEKHAPFLHRAMEQFSDSVVGNLLLKGVPNVVGYSQFSSDIDSIRDLGFSQQRGLFTQIGNSIRDALQYQTRAEQVRSESTIGQVGRTIKFPVKTSVRALSEALKFTVQEMTDTIVNATAISDLRNIDASLRELAVKWASDRISKGMVFDVSNPEFLIRPDEYRKHGKIGRMSSEDNLSHAKAFAQLAGTNLEKMLWDYYQASDKGTKDVSVFGENEDSFKRIVIGAINASTFTNRPIKAQTDTDVGIIQALTGFSTNMAIGMSIAMKGTSGSERTWKRRLQKIFDALGKIIAGFIAFVVIGSLADASRELVNRLFTGKISRKLTAIDPEFWKQKPSELSESLTMNALMIAPFLSGLARLQGGFRPDAGSSFYPIALINSLANYAMGLVRLPVEDWGWVFGNFVRERFPVTQNIPLGSTSGPESAKTKISAGVASFASSADAAGLVKPNLAGVLAGGVVPITEKTGMLSKLAEAGMAASIAERKGDTEGLTEANTEIEHQKQRLIDYHRKQIVEDNERRGITSSDFKVEKDAIAAARRDWSGMNPIARVLGHQPTQSEMDRINAQLSGDRRAAADLAWNAFSRMSDQFPTAKGATPPAETVKTPRAGGGSRFGYSAPVALSASRGGGRRVSLRRSGRTRLGGRLRSRTKTRGLRLRRR